MSATERLRELLDERGVEWSEEEGHTLWWGESAHHQASAYSSFTFGENDRVHLSAMVTPEQAIDATLGRGECCEVYLLMATDIGDGREYVLGVYATEGAATAAIEENRSGYALHHVQKWVVE